jgi:hypothetical protein
MAIEPRMPSDKRSRRRHLLNNSTGVSYWYATRVLHRVAY